ncbi:MAG: adenosylcobalamin-dependent ribonucleoside-diphosphate reductase [Luteitalea sp.]|nr:adenosylcobalamin-dependent ribonucleoside-diphosphate reductase [Luteitalea sp.]
MAEADVLNGLPALPLQDASLFIARSKYFLPGEDLDGMRRRLARALSQVESHPDRWEEPFYRVLHYALPGGRVMANAGAEAFKSNVSTINCTVSRTIEDSMRGIMEALSEAALTLKAGCGIGYDFTTLRPRGAWVQGAGAATSGPLPFMDVFDAACKTVSSAGGRRGAQMGCLDVSHPDIEAFIVAKREAGRLGAFNLSCLITDEFVRAVKNDEPWPLVFPAFPNEMSGADIVWRRWPLADPRYTVNEHGQTACKVYRSVRARELWALIMRSTYDYSDPGFILIDEVNRLNNLWFAEEIRASNPCGEQPLPSFGSCLLGSVNLAALVRRPFTAEACFDVETFREVVRAFSRMLDNVVEANGLPLAPQQAELLRTRRHGMGYFGLGSAMTMLGLRYGSPESVAFTEEVTKTLAHESWRAALELAREKGPAPILAEDVEITPALLAAGPELVSDGVKAGDTRPGRVLHARYSRYMQAVAALDPELVHALAALGARYTHATSIAPTGTMAASVGNNASSGIEPSFAHAYTRNMVVPGEKAKRAVRMESFELLVYRHTVDPDAAPETLPPPFDVTAAAVDPREHIDVQAAAQRWIDASISKTINVPSEIGFNDFQDLYLYAIDKGLKGCTTFRFNPEAHQGVLVSDRDLAETIYEFRLADGHIVRLPGPAKVAYEGHTYTAANLYDALKEEYYGKLS